MREKLQLALQDAQQGLRRILNAEKGLQERLKKLRDEAERCTCSASTRPRSRWCSATWPRPASCGCAAALPAPVRRTGYPLTRRRLRLATDSNHLVAAAGWSALV
jgi:hypothetical protein